MSNTTTAIRTTKEIADRLKKLCEKGDFETAQKELFAKDAVSIESMASKDFPKETKGLDAILAKGKKWDEMVSKSHSIEVSEPVIAGNSFSLAVHMDVTMKNGERMNVTELCVYRIKDGKIISEEFYM